MREASFLALHHKKWNKAEELLNSSRSLSAEEATDLFVELTDDLAYAQTFYAGSMTEKYLNQLTQRLYLLIHQRPRKRFHFWKFWRYEVPATMAKHHLFLLWVFIAFLIFVVIGVVSTQYNEAFPRYVLGDAYVDKTLANIENGDPMAIYKSQGQESMFWGITLNNLKVSGLIFISGILFCVGPFYLLFRNAVMLGSFQYFFVKQDVFLDSFLAIWLHGTIEISCLIIAAFAGVVLGKGFLFPSHLSRRKSTVLHARDGIKIFLGIVPLIILAGFIESFFTRLTDLPAIIRFLLILASATFSVWYFVLLPIQISKKQKS
ncbi:MAG: stage II sporulation protein M [Vicingaceae bacterium]